jgi:hypothetical protein
LFGAVLFEFMDTFWPKEFAMDDPGGSIFEYWSH